GVTGRGDQPVVEQAVGFVPQTLLVKGAADAREMLQELHDQVLGLALAGPVEDGGDGGHGQRVCAHPAGRCERSIGPMLSRPRKPPSKRLLPSASSLFTHQVKLTRSLSKTRLRKSRSRPPSMANAGSAPFGCWNHSRQTRISWYLANAGSRCASGTVWKARSQAANQGYSHLSGIEMMSNPSKLRHREFRPVLRDSGGSGWVGSPSSQRATS